MTEETQEIRDADEVVASGDDSPQAVPSSVSRDEASLEDRAARELAALEAVLRKTRRELRAPVFFEGVTWFLVTVAAVVVSAQFAGLLAGEHGPLVMRVILGVGLSAATLGGAAALLQFVRRRPTLSDVAHLLQRQNPKFRNDIVAALQFGEELGSRGAEANGWSAQLALTHLQRTTRLLLGETDGEGTLAGHLPARDAMPVLLALGGSLVLLVAPLLFATQTVQELWRDTVFPHTDEEKTQEELRPVVGEIDILYSYPPYSDLSPRFEPFTTGQIETLVGTEVTLKTYPLLQGASRFEIVVDTGEGSRVVPMESSASRIEATLLLTKSGTYKFRAVMPDGSIVEDGIDRPIVLQADQVPTINILSHPEQIEVSPDEVLTIQFEVHDDYGIESVARAYAFGNDEPVVKPVDLPELTTVPRSVQAQIEFDLAPLALQPKDVVTVWFEATDNNSLTGPGIGKSAPLLLRVASPEDRHMQLMADEQEVLEALLGVLADYLENPAGERVVNSKKFYEQKVPPTLPLDEISRRFDALHDAHQVETSVLEQMAKVAERMKEDPLMAKRDVTLFVGLHEHLYRLNRDGEDVFNRLASDARQGTLFPEKFQEVADHAALTEDALEKGLIRLENLLALQKMEAVKATAEEIREMKERLKELLEQYRDTPDPELKKAILREIQRLRQRMGELLARMQSQLKQLPQEHMNMEALEQAQMESDAAKLGENLQQIEELIDQGDIDGALQALEDMTANLDAMTQEMGESFEQAEPEGMREMDKALSELMDKANDLEARQREVEERTREAQEKLDEDNRQRTEEMLRQQTAELEKMVEQQRQMLEAIAQREISPHDHDAVSRAAERVEELAQMLENKEIEQALQRAQASHEDLRALQFSMDLSQRYTDSDTERGRAVRKTAGDLQEGEPRGRKIVRRLEEIMEQARSRPSPAQSPQMQQLAGEQREVQRQAGQLTEDVQRVGERFPMVQEQLAPPLDEASREMSGAQQSLDGKKTQQALDHQRAALDSLRKLKQSMKDALQQQKQGQREGQGSPRPKDKVAIPEKDGRTREKFRDGIIEGMKEDRLDNYDSEIQRYYESLMK